MRHISSVNSTEALTSKDLKWMKDLEFGKAYTEATKALTDIVFTSKESNGDEFSLAELFGKDSF
jgi:hypothetical protein